MLAAAMLLAMLSGCSPSEINAFTEEIQVISDQLGTLTGTGASETQPGDAENGASDFPMDPSVMKPWINSNIYGMVTDEVNADLKDDFYLNINHDYLRDVKFSPGYSVDAPLLQAVDTVKERCLEILHDKTLTGRDAQIVQNYYELILDWDTRNEVGVKPLMPFFKELDKVETLDGMTEFLLSDLNFEYGAMLSGVGIGYNADDSSLYEVVIRSTGLTLGDPAEYKEITEDGKRTKELYEELYSYMLERLGYGGDEIPGILKDLFDFEAKVAEYKMTVLESSAPDALKQRINQVTMEELKEMSPHYPLAEYMEKRGYAESRLINLPEPKWLKGLDGLYTEENLPGIKAYVLTHSAVSYINGIDEEAFRKYEELMNTFMGITESSSDEEFAYSLTMATFPDNMSRLYIERYIDDGVKQEITKFCQDVMDTYMEMLDSIDWLSEETREQAKNKLANMTIHAVYPDKWEDDSMISVTSKEDGGNYLQANIDLNNDYYQKNLSKINGTVDREIWGINILDTNAFYAPENNSINIIPGFFCEVSYDSDMSIEEKYGALGSVIGHEISHAFDTEGAQYDAEGNVRNWWTDEDYDAFMKRAGKVVDYYDQVVVFDDGTPYRGQVVHTEAIADMAGLKCVLKMAEKVNGFDYDSFFRAHARLWGLSETVQTMESQIIYDPHPLNYLRCNVALQQFDEFLDTYDIKEGDGMYLAPEDRISVW